MSKQLISDEEIQAINEHSYSVYSDLICGLAENLRDARAKLREAEAARGGAFDQKAARTESEKRYPGDNEYSWRTRPAFTAGAEWQSQQPAPSAPTATPGPELEAKIDKALSVILSIIKEDGRGGDFDLAGAIRNHLEQLLNRCGIPTRVSPTPAPEIKFTGPSEAETQANRESLDKFSQAVRDCWPIVYPNTQPPAQFPSYIERLRDEFALASMAQGVTEPYLEADAAMRKRNTKQPVPVP